MTSAQRVRHARSKWEWGSQPPRGELVAAEAAEQLAPSVVPLGPRGKSRKDTRHWCKGKAGTEHHVTLVRRQWRGKDQGCGWVPACRTRGRDLVSWSCCHSRVCTVCGKVLAYWLDETSCPDYPGTAAQKQAAETKAIWQRESYQKWLDRRKLRKPPITGPQGYRRKR